jgi:hypothetical protein
MFHLAPESSRRREREDALAFGRMAGKIATADLFFARGGKTRGRLERPAMTNEKYLDPSVF